MATGLNVRPDQWPATWAEYQDYWEAMIPQLAISDQVRRDFEDLAHQRVLTEAWGPLGTLLAGIFGPPYVFLTRGNLPPHFRRLMGWDWTPADQRRFERILRLQRLADRLGNAWVIRFLYWLHLRDFRNRVVLGLPVLGRLRVARR